MAFAGFELSSLIGCGFEGNVVEEATEFMCEPNVGCRAKNVTRSMSAVGRRCGEWGEGGGGSSKCT